MKEPALKTNIKKTKIMVSRPSQLVWVNRSGKVGIVTFPLHGLLKSLQSAD